MGAVVTKLEALRKRAEVMLRNQPALASALPSTRDPVLLAHELEVHQVELLMQNEELRHTHLELEKSRDRYADLYNLAPVAYVTLDANGKILDANIAAALLLGEDRYVFLRRPLSAFMTSDDADTFHILRRAVFASETVQGCDLSLRRKDGHSMPVHLDAIVLAGHGEQGSTCGCVILHSPPR